RWAGLWTGIAGRPAWSEQAQQFQKRWAEAVGEETRKQRETLEARFAAGMKQIEQAFQLAQIKDIETLRAKTLELWQKTFQLMLQSSETQLQNFQSAVSKWVELMTPAG